MRNVLYILTVLFLFSLQAGSLRAQTKRALVIGLGQQEDPAWTKINGDKDVPYVEEMLRGAGFEPGNISELVNREATKAAIADAFEALTSRCVEGDIVYIHFSGHGQQMKDLNGDEADALDECWIPYDAYRYPCDKDQGDKHLTDDEVNLYLNRLREAVGSEGKLLVVIDACHSGDATRGMTGEVTRGVGNIFEGLKAYLVGKSGYGTKSATANPHARPNPERWITLSACTSSQVNIEMGNPAVGKLTYALYKEINRNPTGDNADLFRRIKKFVNDHTGSRPQYPVLTGETDTFNITDILR
ncbi:MAG: caspase family protein [Prevotellaceae bacterium]|nr:caspase family protein [Prevotellaceae bacterium]